MSGAQESGRVDASAHEALRRRALLARGAWLAGAATLPALLGPARALAQDDGEEGDAQIEALRRMISAEQASALAYRQAAEGDVLRGEAKALAEELRGAEDAHAKAFTAALEQIGFEAPEAPDSPAGVELLEGFEEADSERKLIGFFVGLELQLMSIYLAVTGKLEAEDLRRSAGQVGASHGEHLVAWRLLRGDAPADFFKGKAGSLDLSEVTQQETAAGDGDENGG